MSDKIFVVVGDSYASFADRDNVLTLSQLMVRMKAAQHWPGVEKIVIGQGIDENARESLKTMLRFCGIGSVAHIDELASQALTHKRSRSSILITDPIRISSTRYECSFAMNDLQDRLSDHVTGQHVGAMLLMEAARQAGIAAIELEWLSGQEDKWGFILENFNARFDNYAFPLPTTILVHLTEIEKTATQISIELQIEFHQAGRQISQMRLDTRLYGAAILEKLERRRADQAMSSLIRLHDTPAQASTAVG